MNTKESPAFSDPGYTDALQKKMYGAERDVASVRFLVILLNTLVYIFLMHPVPGRERLAYSIIIIASVYSLVTLVFQPYKRYKLVTTSLFTSITDGMLICLWIYATGSFNSPFYLLWYISLIAIALRYSFKITLRTGVAYCLAYILVVVFDAGTIGVPVDEMIIRCGYILLTAVLAGLSSKELIEQIHARVLLAKSGEAIAKREAQLKEAQELAHIGSWEWDIASGELSWSDELYRIFGYEPQEISVTKDIYLSHVHWEDLDQVNQNIFKAIRNAESFDGFFRIRDKKGRLRILRSQGKPEISNKGIPEKLLGTCYDITEQKLAEEELLKAHLELEERVKERTEQLKKSNDLLKKEILIRKNAEKSQAELIKRLDGTNQKLKQINEDIDNFVYSASHDLKSPLLNLEALVNLLFQEEQIESPFAREIKAKLDFSFRKIQITIEKLSTVARAQKSIFEDVEAIDLGEILAEVTRENEQVIKSAEAKIRTHFQNVPEFTCSRTCIKSILYNFIINAIKYRNPSLKPEIHISLKAQEGFTELSVADNGLGIDLEKHGNKLFTLFKRFHDHVEGTGIGLYMVKRMVEKYGGRIEVYSTPGMGTTFKVIFPLDSRSVNEDEWEIAQT